MDWSTFSDILIKVAASLLASVITTGVGILFGKFVAKMNSSKIKDYAKDLVYAAEQKFPNEGTKMGPQKMEYVMSQLAAKFPKIKDNQYLYNIAEAAVFQFNKELEESKKLEAEQDVIVSVTKDSTSPIVVENSNNNLAEEIELLQRQQARITNTVSATIDSQKVKLKSF